MDTLHAAGFISLMWLFWLEPEELSRALTPLYVVLQVDVDQEVYLSAKICV